LSLRDHLIRLYARKLGGIISLLEATGESAEAHRLARQALGAMNPELRAAVQAHWRQ
jgi:hypothetical protein